MSAEQVAQGVQLFRPGRYTVIYVAHPDRIEIATRLAGARVRGLCHKFKPGTVPARVCTVIVASLEAGGSVEDARTAVATFLSRLISQVGDANRWSPQAAAELIRMRAWFAAPLVPYRPAAVETETTAATVVEPTLTRARASRLYLRAVL